MSAIVFESKDKPFFVWMDKHPEGHVLNVGRSDDYACLHEVGCSHLTKLGEDHRPNAYTAYDRFKVCAEDSADLLAWMRENRRESASQVKCCGHCNSDIDTYDSGQGSATTAPSLTDLEARRLTEDQFLEFVRSFENEAVETKTGQPFDVKVEERGVRFTPHSTNQSRYFLRSEIPKVLGRFYDIWHSEGIEEALKPVAHKREGGGLNASYYLPLLRRYLELEAEAASGRASDTDQASDTEDATERRKPERRRKITVRIIRDSALARRVKEQCDYVCQVCGKDPIELPSGKSYAEAHHIMPLGSDHEGPDVKENILCVCPTCHVKLDFGVIRLDREQFAMSFPGVERDHYIAYHNENIWGG